MNIMRLLVISLIYAFIVGCGESGNTVVVSLAGENLPTNLTKVHSVDFESNPVGTYSRSLLYSDWGSTLRSVNGIDEGRVSVVQETDKSISVKYPSGSCGPTDSAGCNKGGGAQWLMPLNSSYNELYLSYRLRFNDNFNFVKGGKLPGLTASPAAASIMPPTGGNRPGQCDGFSARFMWKDNGVAETYLYSPAQPGMYGEDLAWQYPGGGQVRFQTGRWHHIVQRIAMNSPGKSDGLIEIWLDGVKVQKKTDAYLRGSACPDLGINQFYFSTFFGGSDPSWSATKDESIQFDDFVVSRP